MLPDSLAGFKGPTSKERGYRKGGVGERGRGRQGEGRIREGRGPPCVSLNFP